MSNVIAFRGLVRTGAAKPKLTEDVAEAPSLAMLRRKLQAEPVSETDKNAKLRLQRREAWWRAERQVQYWKAAMDMHTAIKCAQTAGLPEGDNHEKIDHSDWPPIVESYRLSLVKLLLTPASRSADVQWKQKALAAEKHKYTHLTSARLQQAIAADMEFLAAHPTRRKREGRSA